MELRPRIAISDRRCGSEEHRCCRSVRLCGADRVPGAEHGHFAVHAPALCIARADGPYGNHPVCREPVPRQFGASDRARCRATESAGLLRLRGEAMVHSTQTARTCLENFSGLQSLQCDADGAVATGFTDLSEQWRGFGAALFSCAPSVCWPARRTVENGSGALRLPRTRWVEALRVHPRNW